MLGKPIGNGSSRIVFQIDDETVLKLAKNNKGLAQNEQESMPDWYKEQLGIFPKIYRDYNTEDDYTYIVAEYVLPAKAADFVYCFNITFNDFCKFLYTCEKECSNKRYYYRSYLNKDAFNDLLQSDNDLYQFYKYITEYSVPVNDLCHLSNLGLIHRNGYPRIVILDDGLTDEIYQKFYKND